MISLQDAIRQLDNGTIEFKQPNKGYLTEGEVVYYLKMLQNILEGNGKYEVAKKVETENLLNALECLGYEDIHLTDVETDAIYDLLQSKLAESDLYNNVFNECLEESYKEILRGRDEITIK